MNDKITLQRIRKDTDDSLVLAERYYSVLFALNEVPLTKLETKLVAFTAVRGNISYKQFMEECCERYGTTVASVRNMVGRARKLGILVRERGKIKVVPVLSLNFNRGIVLELKLMYNGVNS